MKRNELWKSLVAKPPKMRFLVMLMCIFCTFNAVFANVSADKTVTIKSENISVYLQPIITQYFIDNKSEIWLLFLIAHSKR